MKQLALFFIALCSAMLGWSIGGLILDSRGEQSLLQVSGPVSIVNNVPVKTNIPITILTLLVTNIHERVETGRVEQFFYAIPNPPPPRALPDLKHRTTEIHEQRLLIMEVEGIMLTNILKSTRTLWKSETFVAKALEPQWEIDTNKTIVDDGKNHWSDTGTIESLIVTNKTLLYIGTNKWDKDKP